MTTWLRGFAVQADNSPGIFLAAAGSTPAIALITVSFQRVKAAQKNPALSSRSEKGPHPGEYGHKAGGARLVFMVRYN